MIRRALSSILLIGPLLSLLGGCQHPCQVDPSKCPALTLSAATTPKTTIPGLIQLKEPTASLVITIGTQDGTAIDEIGELQAAICPAADACAADCKGIFYINPLPKPVLSADGSSRIYTIPGAKLSSLALGTAKLCMTGAVHMSADVNVINRLVSADLPTKTTVSMQSGTKDYQPVAFDIGKNAQGPVAAVVGEYGSHRVVVVHPYAQAGSFMNYKYSLNLGADAPNTSLHAITVTSGALAFYGDNAAAPYVAMQCPLDMTTTECTTNTSGNKWTVSSAAQIDTTASDLLGDRFLVALAAGPNSLRAFPTQLPADGNLQPSWQGEGPQQPVALAAATLKSVSGRTFSDVIAVGKTILGTMPRDVRVFTATTAGPSLDDTYSKGLQAGINAAQGSSPLAAIASADLDGDGLAEVVLLSAGMSPKISILFNLGNGTFRVAGADGFKTDEASLAALMAPANAIDIKLANLDPLASMSPPQIVVLAPTTTTGTPQAVLQVLHLK